MPTGQTKTLTTATNRFTGGSGDDSFDAGLSTGSLQTLNSGDRLDGAGGNDELIAVINGSVTPTLTSIESVSATVITNASTIDLANSTGLTSFTSQGSTAVPTIQGLSKSVAITIRDTAVAHTITLNDVTGTSDSDTLIVSNVNQATGVVTSILGVEALTINATGSDSTLGTLTATDTTTLVVTGNKALTVVDNLQANIASVNASGNSGGVNLDFGGTAMTVSGGAGNDDFSFEAAGAVSVVAGAGNDTIRFDATGTYTTADTVAGGDGNDTLSVTAANAVTAGGSTPTTYTTTGIEKLSLNTTIADSATLTISNIDTSINRLELTGSAADTATTETYVFNAGNSTLELDAAIVTAATVVNLANNVQAVSVGGAATNDTLTIVNGTTSATNVLGGAPLTSTGFETLTINTTGTGVAGAQTVGAITATASTNGVPNIVITGSNQLTTGVVTNTSGTITAAGMSRAAGEGGLIMVTGQNTASSITGSAGDDTLFGAITSAVSQNLSGGAGNDSIVAGSGNDTITGGAGSDTITGGAGNDNIDGGADNDRYIVASGTLTSADTIRGGDGTDTLAFAALLAADNAADVLQSVSGFEVLEVTAAASRTITLSSFINNQTLSRVDLADMGGNTLTVSNAAAAVTEVRLVTGAAGDSLSFSRLVNAANSSLTISSRTDLETNDFGSITASEEETINISGSSAANDFHGTTLTAADLTRLVITGDADVRFDNALGATIVSAVDASGSTGYNEIHATNNVVSVTFSAGSGNSEFTGGLVGDVMNGGAGVDTLIGGAGSDTINGGAGSDSIQGGTGADVINVGSGTADILWFGADGDTGTLTSVAGAISLTGVDIVTGMGNGDTIQLSGLGYATAGGAAGATQFVATFSTSTLAENSGVVLRGSWAAGTTVGSGTFIANAVGADTLFIVDANQATNTSSYEAIVLVGTVATAATAATDGGLVTVTLTV